MGNSDRPATFDLNCPSYGKSLTVDSFDNLQYEMKNKQIKDFVLALSGNAHAYQFFQLANLIYGLNGQDLAEENTHIEHKLLFSTNSSLGFAPSDVSKLELINNNHIGLEVNFLGLNGAQSPLPGFLLEQIVTEDEQGVRKCFLDFFNHRLINLMYLIWKKYRYYRFFGENASDVFSARLFALVGLADENLRSESSINWCKMLSYAGVLAGRSRSPQVVSGIIAHCFELELVTIRQWELRQIAISQEQKMQLGSANVSLGVDSVIGDMVADCTGKFVICIEQLTQERLQDFLPTGKEYQPLMTLVQFILREQMAFDLELTCNEELAAASHLGSGARLGWSSFIGQVDKVRTVRIQARQ